MGFTNIPGDVLLSHDLSVIVSSAQEDFTSVFGMGTGVTPPVLPPRNLINCDTEYARYIEKLNLSEAENLVVKPHDLLVLVSSGCYHPYTPSLSTQWSTGGL